MELKARLEAAITENARLMVKYTRLESQLADGQTKYIVIQNEAQSYHNRLLETST